MAIYLSLEAPLFGPAADSVSVALTYTALVIKLTATRRMMKRQRQSTISLRK